MVPVLLLEFTPNDRIPPGVRLPAYPKVKRASGKHIHTGRPRTLIDWVKALPGRTWDPESKQWAVTNPGPDADRVLAELGFDVDFSRGAKAGFHTCADLATPVFRLDDNHENITWMHQRFSSAQPPAGSIEDPDAPGRFQVWTADLRHPPYCDHVSQHIVAKAHELAGRGRKPNLGTDKHRNWPSILAKLERPPKRLPEGMPTLPAWVKIDLFGHQEPGAYAIIGGHTFVADDMTVGKTFTAVAAHALEGTKRLAVIAPPVSLTNWMSELTKFGYISDDNHRPDGVMWATGRKLRDLPDEGVAVVSNKLLVSRPVEAARLRDWLVGAGNLGGVIVDEAHAYKNWETKQSQMIRNLTTPVMGLRVPLSGTPITAGAAQLATQLAISGHLDTVFGGLESLLTTFCRQDIRGNWVPRKQATEMLKQKMFGHVWIRRRKYDVYNGQNGQPQLPGVHPPQVKYVDVDLTEYREALAKQREKLADWARSKGRKPTASEIRDYAANIQIGFFSPLRKAAGASKTKTAVAAVRDWAKAHPVDAEGLWPAPLVVWVHHKEVMDALKDAAATTGLPVTVIDGSVPAVKRGERVGEFQAGKYAAILCSIQAAGVAINLTRSSDNLFVETDWEPTAHTQALSRTDRIGQTRKVTSTTLLAAKTLDEHMQAVQQAKGAYLDTILGEGNDTSVTGDRDLASPLDVLIGIITEVVEEAWKGRGREAA